MQAACGHCTRVASRFRNAKCTAPPSTNRLQNWVNSTGKVQKTSQKLAGFGLFSFNVLLLSAVIWTKYFHYIMFYRHLTGLNLSKLANRWKQILEWWVPENFNEQRWNKPCPGKSPCLKDAQKLVFCIYFCCTACRQKHCLLWGKNTAGFMLCFLF